MDSNFKSTTPRNKKYLEWIRRLPCLLCRGASDAHHIPPDGLSSISLKTSDLRTIPLCLKHHTEYHTCGKDTFAEDYNLDYEWIISELNRIWEELNELRISYKPNNKIN